jgi:RND family efflux transporter MFP subunit
MDTISLSFEESTMKHQTAKTRLHIVLIGALVLTFLPACKKAAPPVQGPLPVNVVTVEENEVQDWVTFTGRIRPVETVEVRPRVSGYITEVKFTAGALVKKGDPLFVIDPRPYQAEFDRAAGQLEQAQAQLALAEIELTRAKELRAGKITSAQEFDQKAASARQSAGAERAAGAAKAAAALNVEFTKVCSPIDGRVSNARVTAGNLIQPGAGPDSVLTTVVSTDPLYVYFDADENNVLERLKLIEKGQSANARESRIPAFVALSNEKDFPHEGYINFIDNRLEPDTGTVRVRVVINAWDPLLLPGFFVRVRVGGAPPYRAPVIEDKVIGSQQGAKYVFVVKPDNTVERRSIETGAIHEGKRIVKSGLKAGEKVISTRLQLVRPGMPVVPVVDQPTHAPAPVAKAAEAK